MNLVIDIGNTLTKLAWFDKGALTGMLRFENPAKEDITGCIEARPAEKVIISEVGNAHRDAITAAVSPGSRLLLLDNTTPLPLSIVYKTPESLGIDRVAAAVGAWKSFPGSDMLIIDMGTAITIDVVAAAGEYRGGNISPGLYTRFRSLNDYTARLPLVEKDDRFPRFGDNTGSAIAAGVQQGIIYEINGYIHEFETLYPGCKIILTGGDASFFVRELKSTIFAIPELVLSGLNHILEYNMPDKK
ncbi:MAG TPA: type III pantothenate kinase [Bacteroidales bacterium]|nr:type III pantothenate kinase [Bacteroidales bacterium]